MNRPCVIYLIRQAQGAAHGVLDNKVREMVRRLAQRRSASRSEFYQAGTIGLSPSYVFVLSVAEEYHGEHELRYKDEDYRIIRTYENNEGGIELTCQRSDIE